MKETIESGWFTCLFSPAGKTHRKILKSVEDGKWKKTTRQLKNFLAGSW
ncbi:hypothetical protein ACFLVY_00040 [Chloroflexota bacterium]